MRKTLLAALALFAAGGATAQQTPATYCSSLPPASCEVLNVQVQPGPGTGIAVLAHIKYCKAQKLKFLVASVGSVVNWNGSPLFSTSNNSRITTMGSSTTDSYDVNDCTTLP